MLCAPALLAGAAHAADGDKPLLVAQVVDMSAAQQDVSRDFLIGSRAAWQTLQPRGALRGQPIQHWVLETQGRPSELRDAWQAILAQPRCIAVSGCVGHVAAAGIVAQQTTREPTMPIVAPWLHEATDLEQSDRVFGAFADLQTQIRHAIRSLSSMGIQRMGVVYASAEQQQRLQGAIGETSKALGVQPEPLPVLESQSPALRAPQQPIVLFIGGTPELYAFVSALQMPAGRHCYVVALSDVNLQVLAQMGGVPHHTSVIATQSVPLVTTATPVVRAYRDALVRLYDEAPTPLGLAGFVAARYTAHVLANANAPLSRATALAAFQRREDAHLGGFTVAYQGSKRLNAHVTQSMLTTEGRIVG